MEHEDPVSQQEIAAAVEAVRSGNTQAYATVVERFQASVMTLCVSLLRDRLAAEELAQDVFVRAYQRLETFDVRRPMKPWLMKITYQLAHERWRTHARQVAQQRAAAENVPTDRCDAGPPNRLLAEEQSAALWQAVQTLSASQRAAVLLYYREGLSIEQAAQAMNITAGSVKTHLFRARSQIRATLEAKGLGGDKS